MKLYEPTIAREITPTGTNISPHVSAAFHRCLFSLKDISEKCERAKKGRKWGGGRGDIYLVFLALFITNASKGKKGVTHIICRGISCQELIKSKIN